MANIKIHLILSTFSSFLLFFFLKPCFSQTDKLFQGQTTRNLVSENGLFRLGYLETENTQSRNTIHGYFGIRYTLDLNSQPYAIWIANRNSPYTENNDQTITIDDQGSLKILQSGSDPILLYSAQTPIQTSVVLENSGNLVLQEIGVNGSTQVLWETFDYPSDTWLPGMKLGVNLKTGKNWSLTSWRSNYSASKGSFTFGLDPNSKDELVIWWNGDVLWRSGHWQNNSNLLSISSSYNFSYVSNANEVYFNYSARKADTIFPMLRLITNGSLIQGQDWPVADCIDKFDSSSGCMGRALPTCRKSREDLGFVPQLGSMYLDGMKFKEDNLSLTDCKYKCFSTCSCVSYTSTNLDDTGCEIWSSMQTFRASINGKVIYALESHEFTSKVVNWWLYLTIIVAVIVIVPALGSMVYSLKLRCQVRGEALAMRKKLVRELENLASATSEASKTNDEKTDGKDLQIYSYEVIASATNYFSIANKLGEGGYGPVYKGKLTGGTEIAIKRLSRSSGQGLEEFKNEALLISKLQHTNLVRLLGFCVQGDESILIYEYLPNKSLDFFLFDSERRSSLNWKTRFGIIEGIAQGLLYLHKYSRLKVIHRDLKASNVLLGNDMNPKISDFGLARIFGANETEANTIRVVGTHGYMSPEYVFHGIVSVKTDVFSFGVLLLEIVSGKRNNSYYDPVNPLNQIGYAWKLWTEGRGLELMDPALDDESNYHNEVLRCIHVGLLCVQDNAADRPTMSDVVSMFSHEFSPIAAPKQPAFFTGPEQELDADGLKNKQADCSLNCISISIVEAR